MVRFSFSSVLFCWFCGHTNKTVGAKYLVLFWRFGGKVHNKMDDRQTCPVNIGIDQ